MFEGSFVESVGLVDDQQLGMVAAAGLLDAGGGRVLVDADVDARD